MRRKLSEGRSLARMMWQTKSLWMLPCLVVAAWLAVAVVVRGPLFPPRGERAVWVVLPLVQEGAAAAQPMR